MCLGVPAQVVELKEGGKIAVVDFGGGVLREVDASFTPVRVGDYVVVHAGTIIATVDPDEAVESIRTWNEIISMLKAEDLERPGVSDA